MVPEGENKVPLSERIRNMIVAGEYARSLDVLAAEVESPLPRKLLELRVFAEIRLGRYTEALRWIAAAGQQTPKLRRFEIEILAALRAPHEIVERLRSCFEELPDNAADFAFYSINELVFQGAFAEARWVIDHTVGLFAQYQPGAKHDFTERRKYIDGTERIYLAARADPRFELSRVTQRLVEVNVPTVAWDDVVTGNFGAATAEVSDCLQGVRTRNRPPGSARFFRSPSLQPTAVSPLTSAKPTRGFVLRGVQLTLLEGTINVACADGVIFPELAARGSTTNAGFTIVRRDIARTREARAFLLPPLGDPGHFNAVLNGLFGMLVWSRYFTEMRLVVPPGYGAILRRYADLLAVAPGRIVWNDECENFAFDACLVLFNEGRHVTGESLAVFQWLAQALYPQMPAEPRASPWIYVSRRKARQRPLHEEEQLESQLAALGFDILCLEDLTPLEQMRACRHARGVVAPHGAGLTNLIFAESLDWLIELIPETYHVRGFENLALQLGAEYVGVIGQTLGGANMESLSWTVAATEVIELVNSLRH